MTNPLQNSNQSYDHQAVKEAIELIVGAGKLTELRALDAVTVKDKWPHTESGYFDDPEKLARAVGMIKSAKGIYFIPNPIDCDLLARAVNRIRKTPKGESTADTNITARHWLLIDADAQRPSGISATDTQHEAAIQRTREVYVYLRDLGWPEPIAADSGNGGHLLYRIDLPVSDGGIVQNCLVALAQRFDDDTVKVDTTVYNPARIWKLYGTIAAKGDDAAEIGRPHRRAAITNVPDKLIVVEKRRLESLAEEAADVEPEAKPTSSKNSGSVFSVADFVSRHRLDVNGPRKWNGGQGTGEVWTFSTSPMCDHDDMSQDYFRFMFATDVEPTNNHTEQQIRHCVIDRRITQGTRSEAGRRYHERMWTAIATCGKQKRSFFHFLHQSISANLTGQKAPSLLAN